MKDLLFLKTQREKTSSKGAMMISSSIDVKEQIQEEKRLKLKELMKKRAQNNREKESKAKHELETRIDEDDSVSPMEEESPPLQEKKPAVAERIQTRNTIEVTGLASTAIRYQASSRMAGALATAYLGDLIRAGILPPEAASLAVDGAKVQRAWKK